MVDTYFGSAQTLSERLYRTASCDVSIYDGANAIEQAASAWHALEGCSRTTSFQSLTVARATACAHVARGERPRIVVVRERGRPLVVFPTVLCRFAGLATVRFLGDPFIQYGDALVSPDATPAHLSAAWSVVVNPRQVRIGLFRRVRVDSPFTSLLASQASTVGCEEAPFVDVVRGKNTNARDTREMRRLHRRLAECGPLAFEVQRGSAAVEILSETLALKRAWLAERGLPSAVLGNADWEQVLFAAAATSSGSRELTAARLTVDGKTAATEIGFTDSTTWYAYMAAFAPIFAKYGPGHVLMQNILAWCVETKRTVYDMLPPSQPYKLTLATGSVPVRDYAIAVDAMGHAAVLAARMLPAAKLAVMALPLRLRQKMIGLHVENRKNGN